MRCWYIRFTETFGHLMFTCKGVGARCEIAERVRALGPVTYMIWRPFASGVVPNVMVGLSHCFAMLALIK